MSAKPLLNLGELPIPEEEGYAVVGEAIGAQRLGYNVSLIAPGETSSPFHNHHVNEEMFLILEGEGVLRFGEHEHPVRPLDIIACPPGKREVAHQLRNTGEGPLKYLALSTLDPHEVCEFPDTDQIGVYVGEYGKMDIRMWFQASQSSGPPWEATPSS